MSGKIKQVVITGTTRGLGRALAEAFLAKGLVVAGCGRSAEAIAQLREQGKAKGWRSMFDVVHVASDDAVAAWSRRILDAYGPPDLLINNAAILPMPAPLWNIPSEAFDACVDVNLKGVVNVIRHFAPAMIRRKQGVIANLSSGWGRSVAPRVAPYCATKWAIEGLTKALALELPAGMAAVAVNPGIIDTEMLRRCFGPEAAHYPSPEEWAQKAAPFFLSLDSRHNGQSLTVPLPE